MFLLRCLTEALLYPRRSCDSLEEALLTSILAMLSLFANHPPRTRVAHLSRIVFDDGRSSIEFHLPEDRYLVINRLPPTPRHLNVNTWPHPANCALNPPMHWHSKQTETFHVLGGEARFYVEGQVTVASSGETVHIPLAAHHTFRNASSEKELLIEFTLDPTTRHRDESLFSAFGPSCAWHANADENF